MLLVLPLLTYVARYQPWRAASSHFKQQQGRIEWFLEKVALKFSKNCVRCLSRYSGIPPRNSCPITGKLNYLGCVLSSINGP